MQRGDSALRISIVLLLSLWGSTIGRAGTVSLDWSPVADEDLAGYRVYYGTSASTYSSTRDAGLTTSTTVPGLDDCTAWYLAVKAYDAGGNESESWSNEVSGWARPTVTSVAPSSAEQGLRSTITVSGSNFQWGAALSFADPAIVVHSVSVDSCSRITADVTIGVAAILGAHDVQVTNPDQVFGTGVGSFSVSAAVPPRVTATTPADGATGVPTTVEPLVTFSEPVSAATVLPSTVRLLDGAGSAVAQAPGSPLLSADKRVATLRPAAPLAEGATYRIEVTGGAAGVLDLAGHGMDSTFRQGVGFTVERDMVGPVITAVVTDQVTGTSARIRWTTDEAADSQVAYRRLGGAVYTETPRDPALVETHQVVLQGLEPGTTYEYHVLSADAGGNRSTSSPDGTFTTTGGGGCVEDEDCDDTLFCNGPERCDAGTCLPGAAPACEAGRCSETLDACSQCIEHSDCPAGSFCDGSSGQCAPSPAAPALPIKGGASWRYLEGNAAPPAGWNGATFDDTRWAQGQSGFGYGGTCDALHATKLNQMRKGYSSVYVRRSFHVDQPSAVKSLTLTVDYDAGFVAYLNGVEAARRNVLGTPPPHTQTATGLHGCSDSPDPHPAEAIPLNLALLVPGTNVLSIQGHKSADKNAEFTLFPTLSMKSRPLVYADGDYDGDGRSDLATFSSGRWTVESSRDGLILDEGWGRLGDQPVPGDYDGDGRTDFAVYRGGDWIVRRSSDDGRSIARWGAAGEVLVPSDYDGDGITDYGLYRAGRWVVRRSTDGSRLDEYWGGATDVTVPADYDGDGKADLAVYRAGRWVIRRSSDPLRQDILFGNATDVPVPHDYDADGKADAAVYREGRWLVRRSADLGRDDYICGAPDDIPVPLRYDADPKADGAAFRDGVWTIRPSITQSNETQTCGAAGHLPVSK